MRKMKLLRFTAALLVGFTAGAYAVRLTPKSEHPELRRLRESVELTAPLYRQYRAGDYAQAKEALLTLARHLDRYDAESPEPGLSPYAGDAMMTFARLAKLEERQGAAAAAGEYMREAVRRCEWIEGLSRRARHCSETYLRDSVVRTDAMPIYELGK